MLYLIPDPEPLKCRASWKKLQAAWVSFKVRAHKLQCTKILQDVLCPALEGSGLHSKPTCFRTASSPHPCLLCYRHYNLFPSSKTAGMNKAQKMFHAYRLSFEVQERISGTEVLHRSYKKWPTVLGSSKKFGLTNTHWIEHWQKSTENERYELLYLIDEKVKMRTLGNNVLEWRWSTLGWYKQVPKCGDVLWSICFGWGLPWVSSSQNKQKINS